MKGKQPPDAVPSWLDRRNDRKLPFTDVELNVLADDFIARMAGTQVWQHASRHRSRRAESQRRDETALGTQDANCLINWQPDEPSH